MAFSKQQMLSVVACASVQQYTETAVSQVNATKLRMNSQAKPPVPRPCPQCTYNNCGHDNNICYMCDGPLPPLATTTQPAQPREEPHRGDDIKEPEQGSQGSDFQIQKPVELAQEILREYVPRRRNVLQAMMGAEMVHLDKEQKSLLKKLEQAKDPNQLENLVQVCKRNANPEKIRDEINQKFKEQNDPRFNPLVREVGAVQVQWYLDNIPNNLTPHRKYPFGSTSWEEAFGGQGMSAKDLKNPTRCWADLPTNRNQLNGRLNEHLDYVREFSVQAAEQQLEVVGTFQLSRTSDDEKTTPDSQQVDSLFTTQVKNQLGGWCYSEGIQNILTEMLVGCYKLNKINKGEQQTLFNKDINVEFLSQLHMRLKNLAMVQERLPNVNDIYTLSQSQQAQLQDQGVFDKKRVKALVIRNLDAKLFQGAFKNGSESILKNLKKLINFKDYEIVDQFLSQDNDSQEVRKVYSHELFQPLTKSKQGLLKQSSFDDQCYPRQQGGRDQAGSNMEYLNDILTMIINNPDLRAETLTRHVLSRVPTMPQETRDLTQVKQHLSETNMSVSLGYTMKQVGIQQFHDQQFGPGQRGAKDQSQIMTNKDLDMIFEFIISKAIEVGQTAFKEYELQFKNKIVDQDFVLNQIFQQWSRDNVVRKLFQMKNRNGKLTVGPSMEPHVVTVVPLSQDPLFPTTHQGKDYLYIRNSWGVESHDNGYIRIQDEVFTNPNPKVWNVFNFVTLWFNEGENKEATIMAKQWRHAVQTGEMKPLSENSPATKEEFCLGQGLVPSSIKFRKNSQSPKRGDDVKEDSEGDESDSEEDEDEAALLQQQMQMSMEGVQDQETTVSTTEEKTEQRTEESIEHPIEEETIEDQIQIGDKFLVEENYTTFQTSNEETRTLVQGSEIEILQVSDDNLTYKVEVRRNVGNGIILQQEMSLTIDDFVQQFSDQVIVFQSLKN